MSAGKDAARMALELIKQLDRRAERVGGGVPRAVYEAASAIVAMLSAIAVVIERQGS